MRCLCFHLSLFLLRWKEVLFVELFEDLILLVCGVSEPVLIPLVLYVLSVNILRDYRFLLLLVLSLSRWVGVVLVMSSDRTLGLHHEVGRLGLKSRGVVRPRLLALCS